MIEVINCADSVLVNMDRILDLCLRLLRKEDFTAAGLSPKFAVMAMLSLSIFLTALKTWAARRSADHWTTCPRLRHSTAFFLIFWRPHLELSQQNLHKMVADWGIYRSLWSFIVWKNFRILEDWFFVFISVALTCMLLGLRRKWKKWSLSLKELTP